MKKRQYKQHSRRQKEENKAETASIGYGKFMSLLRRSGADV